MAPKVSLALPVYNGQDFLAEALNSILAQDFGDFELIITDNASRDHTTEICRRYETLDPRIRYYRNARNLGAAENLNRGFALARGRYFKWCAHDDLLSANFLRLCVHALDRHPDVVLACGNCQPIGPTARPLGTRTAPFTAARRPEDGFLDLFERSEILIFGLFRADALAKTSLHRKYYGSDRTLIAETALLGPLVRVPGITLYNRCHPARSNIIEDKRLRALWQATDGSNRRGLEHCHLVSDLFSIAWAQHQPARFFRTLTSVLWWAAKPRQILRLALELIGLVSPGAQMSLRSHAWRIIHKAKRAHPPAALRRRCAK